MKILPRQELNTLKQQEQEREVKTGLKIATQVDEIRELRQKEEQNLREFRDKALSEVQQAINDKAQEKTALEAQIEQRKRELQKLFEPLDKQFALYVRTERMAIESEQKRLAEVNTDLALQKHEADIKDAELEKKSASLQTERIEAARLLRTAQEERDESKEIVARARNEAQTIVMQAEEVMHEALIEQRQNKSNALANLTRKQELDDREKELERRELEVEIEKLKYYSPVKRL